MAKRFRCPKCNRRFKMAAHLGRHVKAVHGRQKKRVRSRTPARSLQSGRVAASRGDAWNFHARALLSHLTSERQNLAEELSVLDQRIETVSTILGPGARRVASSRGRASGGITGRVLSALEQRGESSIHDLVKATNLARSQVYPCLMNLKKTKRIKATARGVYALC